MRIEGEHRFSIESPIGPEIGHRQREGESRRRFRARGIGLFGPIGESIREAVVLALLDVVELLRGVRVRTVLGGEHLTRVVPAKTIGVAGPPGIHLQGGRLHIGLDAPEAPGDGGLSTAKPLGIRAGQPAIGATSIAGIQMAVRSEGDVLHRVDVGRASRVVGLEPGLELGGMPVGHGGAPIDGDDVLVGSGRLVLLIGGDVEPLLPVESHPQDEEGATDVVGSAFQIAIGRKDLLQGRIRRIQSPHIALLGQHIQSVPTTIARQAHRTEGQTCHLPQAEPLGRLRQRRVTVGLLERFKRGISRGGPHLLHSLGSHLGTRVAPIAENVVQDRRNLLVLQDGRRHHTGIPTRVDRDLAVQSLADDSDGPIDVGQEVVGTGQGRENPGNPLPSHLVTGKAVLQVEVTSSGTLGLRSGGGPRVRTLGHQRCIPENPSQNGP